MTFNVNEFRSHFSRYNDFAKPDKFDVLISVPEKLIGSFGSKELSLQCESAELPGRTISMIEHRHYAFTERIPQFSFFGECTLTFLCNGELAEKKFFDAWQNEMISYSDGLVKYTNESDYTTEIKIRQYSTVGVREGDESPARDGERSRDNRILDSVRRAAKDRIRSIAEPILGSRGPRELQREKFKPRKVYECILVNAVPIIVAPIALSWADDSIMRLNVTFVFTKWYSEDIPVVTNSSNLTEGNINNISSRSLDRRILDQVKVEAKNRIERKVNDKLGKVIRIPRPPRF